VDIAMVEGQRVTAMPCDPALVDDVEQAAAELSLPSVRLPSGAGHDAQVIATMAPIAMIFVPSRGGVSHNPAEHTEPEALVAGAEVLLHSLLRTDRRLR
jgi:N-carbamoyl-L-amino-acid hydrolase